MHSLIFDYMGFEPSVWNKINIHIGGIKGDRGVTALLFRRGFSMLSIRTQQRLTVENDDSLKLFSTLDLYTLIRPIPIVFDYHHHRIHPGGLTERQAFLLAYCTWPKGVPPVYHYSESSDPNKPLFRGHSYTVSGPITLYRTPLYLIIEAKGKDIAVEQISPEAVQLSE